MNKTEALNRLSAMENEAKELRAIIEAPEKALRLIEAGSGSLRICYGDKEQYIGYISSCGRCNILNTGARVELYEQWRADGMPVDCSLVEWRGEKYCIDVNYRLMRSHFDCGEIYDFEECSTISSCKDTNIIRHKHNNRPVSF
jgi:hypothetical protein